MASIQEEIDVKVASETVWDAVREVGAIHTRLAPGVVVGTEILPGVEPVTRRVTFSHGAVVDEVIVDIDEARRRLAWTIQGGTVRHHNGVMQVFASADGGSRVVWTADFLPDGLAQPFGASMARAMAAMKSHLERQAASDAR